MTHAYMPKSKSDVHITPDEVYDIIRSRWNENRILFDPCPVNPDFDGINEPWKNPFYVNPPYTNLGIFVKKADFYNKLGYTGYLLLPSNKTDQTWFQKYIIWRLKKQENFYWFDHRLKFKNNKWGSMQPHFLVRFE